jgi:hypothetical protein
VAEQQNKPNHARCDTCHRPEIEPVDPARLVLGATLEGRE